MAVVGKAFAPLLREDMEGHKPLGRNGLRLLTSRAPTPMGKSTHTRQIGRDAGNGQFITIREAHRRPATTTVERITAPKKK